MKKILFIIFLVSVKIVLSQSLEYRQKRQEAFFVYKNTADFLPIKNIDSTFIQIETIGGYSKFFFNSALRYTENLDTSNLLRYNLLVLLVFDDINVDFSDLENKSDLVIFFFGKKPKLSNLENVLSVIYSPYNDSLAQDYAAQLLFGAFNAYGNDSIKGGIRFKYTIPQEVGIDSNFLFTQIDSIVLKGIELEAYPGCQIFIAVDKKVILHKSYGFRTYAGNIPVKNNYLYDLASITKIAASAPCLMLLYQNDKFSLNDRISDYYKPFRHSNKREITFKDALTHQAGLIPWIPFWKKLLFKNNHLRRNALSNSYSRKYSIKVADNLYLNRKYRRKIFKLIKKSPLLPEKRYKYSDLSFYIYPLIISKLYGNDFLQCLKENFYDPLGSYTMTFNPLNKYDCKRIVPTEYDKVFRKQLICGYVHDEGAAMLGGVSGHAGLFADANDLAKLMQMYLDYGVYGAKRYLDSTIVRIWTSYQYKDKGNRRGLAFDKPLLSHKEIGTPSAMASDLSFGHSGFTGTFAWADPKYKMVFVFLSNRVYPSREHKNLLRYNIRPSIHTVIYKALKHRSRN